MPYNSSFSPSTFARKGKKRATYIAEFEKDLAAIATEQANAGGKRFKWHFFFIQDFDISDPSNESDIDYLVLDKFNSAWGKKLAPLLKTAPASTAVCKGRCWVSSLEGKGGEDAFYLSISGGITPVDIDGRDNPSSTKVSKAIIAKALRKEWLKRLKIKVGEAEVTDMTELGAKPDVELSIGTDTGIQQKIAAFKTISEDDEIGQINKLIEIQQVLEGTSETEAQAFVDAQFQEIEHELEHETQQDYDLFQKEEREGMFDEDYDLAKKELQELREFHKLWKEAVSLMEKAGITTQTKAKLDELDKLIEEEEEQYKNKPSSNSNEPTGDDPIKEAATSVYNQLKSYKTKLKTSAKNADELDKALKRMINDFKKWDNSLKAKDQTRFKKVRQNMGLGIQEENNAIKALREVEEQFNAQTEETTAESLEKMMEGKDIFGYETIYDKYENEINAIKALESFNQSFKSFEEKNPIDTTTETSGILAKDVLKDMDNPGSHYTDILDKAKKETVTIDAIIKAIPNLFTTTTNLRDVRLKDVATNNEKITKLKSQLPQVKETLDKIQEKAQLGQNAVDIFEEGKKVKVGTDKEKELWGNFTEAIREFEKVRL